MAIVYVQYKCCFLLLKMEIYDLGGKRLEFVIEVKRRNWAGPSILSIVHSVSVNVSS